MLILGGILTEIVVILMIDYTPLGNLLFGTAPVPPVVWGLALVCAGLMAVLEETRKAAVRASRLRTAAAGAAGRHSTADQRTGDVARSEYAEHSIRAQRTE